jgi:hypothetical protein
VAASTTGEGELSGAEPGHEITAPDAPGFFQRLQHRVQLGEAAERVAQDRLARQDPITLEQDLDPRRSGLGCARRGSSAPALQQ